MPNDYELQVELETKCFLNCRHCSAESLHSISANWQCFEHLLKLLSIAPNAIRLNFSGGEPLASDRINYVTDIISAKCPNVTSGIFSCGLRSYGGNIVPISYVEANRLHDSGVSTAYISLYSDVAADHDFVTGFNGSHALTAIAISNLLRAGITVLAHVVVSKVNIFNLNGLVAYAERLGISEVRFLRLVKTGQAIRNWSTLGVSTTTQNFALSKLYFNRSQLSLPISISGYPELAPCRLNANSQGCQAGSALLFITYSGDVFPCACTRNAIGNRICNISDVDAVLNYMQSSGLPSNRCLNPLYTD